MHPRPAFTIRRPILLATLWWAIQAVPVAGQLQEPMDTVDVLAELITVEDGLPQGMVQCMAQDKAGYLWFGTRGGLARSDGYGFTIYQHDDKDSNSISSNIVRCVLEDRQGLLWLGFESGAVDRFDPRTGTFMHVVRDPNGGLGPVPEIRSMAQDHNGNIWIHAISGGLRVAREGTPDPRPLLEDPRKVFPRIAWPEQVHGIGVAGTGDVWIAFGDSLMVVDTETKQCTQRWRGDYLALASDNPTELQTLTPDAEGSGMWLKRADEFYHFDGGKDRSIPLIDHAGRIPPTIYAVQVLQGSTWISASMSCFRSKKVDGRMEYVRFREIHGKRIKPEMSVIRFLEDRSGTIWAGTNGYGVLKVTRIRQRFHHLPDVATVYKASTSGALALAKAEDDHWTDATGRITQGNVFSSLRAHGLMATPNVWAMDPQGRVWISTAVSWYVKSELTVIDPAGGMAFPPIVRHVRPPSGDCM